jgi:hypothetical protein
VVFEKADGSYVEQFVARDDGPSFGDVRGMYVLDRGEAEAPLLVWAGPRGVYQTELAAPVPTEEPSPSPSPLDAPGSPALPPAPPPESPAESPPDGVTPAPTSPEPTDERPRRTPRATPPS